MIQRTDPDLGDKNAERSHGQSSLSDQPNQQILRKRQLNPRRM